MALTLDWDPIKATANIKKHGVSFNPDFALGRGIRQRMPDIFFLKKFVHGTTMAFTFFVETISASFVSVLTPNAKFGFNEAASVFEDDCSATGYDPDHSIDEHRFITVGLSNKGRVLIVSHTDRSDVVRIISARRTTRQERIFYEEE